MRTREVGREIKLGGEVVRNYEIRDRLKFKMEDGDSEKNIKKI